MPIFSIAEPISSLVLHTPSQALIYISQIATYIIGWGYVYNIFTSPALGRTLKYLHERILQNTLASNKIS